jgi:hypothetical protein
MARYEAESVEFTERQFEGVRQREDKRIQQQEKREDKLLKLKTAAKGLNALINQRADEFEANQIQVKTAYQNHINKAEQLKKLQEQINSSGRTATDFFKNSYSAALKQEAEAEATALGQTFTKQNYSYIDQQAYKMAQDKAKAFEAAIQQANDIPSLEEFQANWDKYSEMQAPRTIFGAISKTAKNFFRKETPETLEYKNKKAKDVLFNSPLNKEFKEFETVYDTYDALGFDGTPILDAVRNQDKNRKVKSTQIVQQKDWKNASNGIVPVINKLVTTYEQGAPTVEVIDGLQDSEVIDSEFVTNKEINEYANTIKPEFREAYFDRVKNIRASKGFVTANDWIDINADHALAEAKLVGVDDYAKIVEVATETWQQHLPTLYLTPELKEKYKAKYPQIMQMADYTPMFTVDRQTNQYQPDGKLGSLLRDEGITIEAWTKKWMDSAGLSAIEPKSDEGKVIQTRMIELAGFQDTGLTLDPEEDEKELIAISKIDVINGFRTMPVDDASLFRSDLPNKPGEIKIDANTNQIYFSPINKPVDTEVTSINTDRGTVVAGVDDDVDKVQSANDFNLSDEDFNELVANARPLSSSPDILQIKGIDNVVDSVSLDVLIDKGYLTRAGKRSNFAIQRARSKYEIDLRRAIKEKKEEQNILLASK